MTHLINARFLLESAIRDRAKVLEGNILDVTKFINHGVDTSLAIAIARGLAGILLPYNPTKVLTTETSGIAPAFAVAEALGELPLVFARRNLPVTMGRSRVYTAPTVSHTRGEPVRLYVSDEVLQPGDRILLVDDFLASGRTLRALLQIASDAGCELLAVVVLIEKVFENGRAAIRQAFPNIPIISVVSITSMKPGEITFATKG